MKNEEYRIVYENTVGYVWQKSKLDFEVRINAGVSSIAVGNQKTLTVAKRTLDRLERYPASLKSYLKI